MTAFTNGTTPDNELVVPHHYLASLDDGTGGIYVSLYKAVAYQEALADAGHGNIVSFRPATQAEVDWHKLMGGWVEIAGPATED